MNTIYFIIYESRKEHFWSYPFTWKSLLANIDLGRTKVVVTSYGSGDDLMLAIPPQFEVRRIPGWPSLNIWNGTKADYVKWETSQEGEPDDRVLFLDARDIIFQRDPFSDIAGKEVACCCEGVTHDRCSWNMWDHGNIRKYFPGELCPDVRHWPVLNFGVVGGRRAAVRLALIMVWLIGCRFNQGGSDQGVWNFAWNHYLGRDAGFWMCQPELHDWCIVGDHSAHIRPEPYWQDGVICCGTTRQPYAIVHQWERPDCAWPRDILIRKWS